jgi:polygalacturonase
VGDDNIAIKSGHRLPGRDFACEDITVTDCTFLHGHGMSIGSETAGGVRHLNVSRCTFEGTANGIRIKSPRGRGGAVEDLTYTEITMKDVDPAITITCYYPKIPKEDAAQPVNAGTPRFQNIRISNLTATCARNVGTIVGLPESPVSGVVLKNVNITATTGLLVRNAKDVQTSGLEITTKQGPPLLLENAQVDGAGSFKDP